MKQKPIRKPIILHPQIKIEKRDDGGFIVIVELEMFGRTNKFYFCKTRSMHSFPYYSLVNDRKLACAFRYLVGAEMAAKNIERRCGHFGHYDLELRARYDK